MQSLDVKEDEFNPIFSQIKERYLSSDNFPKLIIGTGLSIAMNVPGMAKLAEKLEEEFDKCKDVDLTEKWKKYSCKIKSDGLEAALLDISTDEENFVEKIKHITGIFILEEEYKIHDKILSTYSGFEKLLRYLSNTVSVNNRIIDIMTPNYDRIIEVICDKLNLTTTLGFSGGLYQKFDESILQNPYSYFNKNIYVVRIFKPHGSVNWIKDEDKEYQTNDYELLKNKKECIDIITPGSMKYKYGMINDIFRSHRETFNKLITDNSKSYSLFIYGYGFNDQHFNTVFQNTTKNVLVLTRSINHDFLDRAIKNKNWTLFYKCEIGNDEDMDENVCFMVYEGKKYKLSCDLWDIDVFTSVFLG
ncbi:MAG TPA: hypothetical protein DDY58_09125 [Terrisporobacter glycolicus]|uniref:SIR2 family protein n=1 Tax=Terrisporobacter TaxID=1505652 RepID=UPI000E7E8825|nr:MULTISPECIES: SIR2 family protein [Terrisporobacter]HBI92575.1 hypothetical protein [Terrisporobacter hibernicus]